MRRDVVKLREFYASGLGKAVREALCAAVRRSWPDMAGDTLMGIGYANPILRSYLRKEKQDKSAQAQLFSLMPAEQGAIVWPDYRMNRSVLCDDLALPLRDGQLNRLLLIHALEHCADDKKLIQECWRVLMPAGRMLIVAPRRSGLWARLKASPFSGGKSYSSGQLRAVACEPFTHLHTHTALYFLPHPSRGLLRVSGLFERICPWLIPLLGGVWVMEVEKQIYACIKERKLDARLGQYVPAAAIKPALSRD